jgi:Ethylbenzene dehydrogenase/Prokaryotic cytochrome b561
VKIRKTDYGTIILHWLLVAAISVAVFTGLRIATEGPYHLWVNELDAFLPRTHVWVPHMQSAVVQVAAMIAYTVYLARSGLSRRVQLDKNRLRGLLGKRTQRLGAFGAILMWAFFLSMVAMIVTGSLLYLGIFPNHFVRQVHWYGTWAILGFIGLHVLNHFAIGGSTQLMRVFRPDKLPAPPPRLDAVELLTMLVEQEERLNAESEPVARPAAARRPAAVPRPAAPIPMHAPLQPAPAPLQPAQAAPVHEPSFGRLPIDRQEAPWKGGDRSDGRDEAPWKNGGARPQARRAPAKRRNPTFQANPLVVAAAVAITGASLMFASDWLSSDTLVIHRIDAADAPVLDGDTSDRVWRNIEPISVLTNQGGNLDGKGDSRVEIRAAHDGEWAYFLFTWEDPTRSLKQLPMVKERNGWHLLQNGYWNGDEHDYNEDKFSVLFTTLDMTLAGDRTFHASPEAVSDAPSTKTGRGLHYTPGEGIYADVWQWKATSGGPTGWLDDDHFGPPLPPTPQQAKNLVPYKGGFEPDPGTANYSDNFVVDVDADGNRNVTPRRLPKDVAAMTKAMGDISLDPNVGESDGARWFMTETESVPYSAEADQSLPIGTVIPGVIIAGDYTGDRADVRCAARWAAGHWALEVARRMDTHSKYDIPFKSGIYMRVSVFDHVQVRHTRHVRPIRVEVE